MKKVYSFILLALFASLRGLAITPITGPHGECVGSVAILTELTVGGTWSSSSTAIATIGTAASGVDTVCCAVTGVSAGVVNITYTVGASYVTYTFTVGGTPPVSITGTTTFCLSASSTLSDATPGGTWSSSNPSIASVNSAGVVYGASGGTATIYYATGAVCSTHTLVTITPTYISDTVYGLSTLCAGSTATYTNYTAGGTWSSSNTSLATVVSSTGVVTGVSVGSVNISYTVTGACGTSFRYKPITVSSTTSAGTITGTSTVYVGSSTALSDGAGGGVWSSSAPAIASVNAATGMVYGIASGSVIITYSVTGCGGTATATFPMTVSIINRISGNVHFSSGGDTLAGNIKVWLITYNTSTLNLEAIDSVTVSTGTGTLTNYYYEFLSVPTDSYRVKAAFFPTIYPTTGFLPTYHTSSFYWHDANVVRHTGYADDYNDINMAFGLVPPSGPGFIGGSVMAGANKGTSGSIPVTGLLIYLQNAATGAVVQYGYTDATGIYSFSSLPYGNYFVYPELINYGTIPYSSITINSSNPTKSAANFIEHTLSHTITPANVGVEQMNSATAYAVAFPNPTSGKLNIMWQETAKETGIVSIADMAGREVYTTKLLMTEGAGIKQIDLSAIVNGTYLITVKSGNINYTDKVQVVH